MIGTASIAVVTKRFIVKKASNEGHDDDVDNDDEPRPDDPWARPYYQAEYILSLRLNDQNLVFIYANKGRNSVFWLYYRGKNEDTIRQSRFVFNLVYFFCSVK